MTTVLRPAASPSRLRSSSAVPAGLWLISSSTSLAVVLWSPARTWLVFLALLVSTAVVFRHLTSLLQFFALGFLLSFLLVPAFAEKPSADPGATAVIGLFLLGFLGGAQFAVRPDTPPDERWSAASRFVPIRSLLFVAAAGLAVRSALLVAGQVGLQAQYSSGSSESGLLALFATIGSACAAAAFWSNRSSPVPGNALSILTGSLVLGHAVSLAFSGFRGAGPSYLILVWIIGAYARRGSAPTWRTPKKLFAIGLILILGASLFVVGAVVREGYAAAAGKTSSGTQGVPTLDAVIKRLDGRSSFEVGYVHRDDSLAHEAVDPLPQVAAAIPRVLFPDKPVVDYGRRIAYAFYGIPYSYRTSSTITFLGDLYINVGLPGTFVLAILLGFGVQRLSQRLLSAGTGLSYALAYLLSAAVVRTEASVILNVVELVREVVFLVLVLTVVRVVAPVTHSRDDAFRQDRPLSVSRPSLSS